MKRKFLTIAMIALFIGACSSDPKQEEAAVEVKEAPATSETTSTVSAEKLARGKTLYTKYCLACHQAEGQGVPGAFPPLASADYLNADVDRAIHGVIFGQTGEMIVNGNKYNMAMPPQPLNDEEVAEVLTFVYNSWGNNNTEVFTEKVTEIRSKK